ncbi:hypothetical protein QCA50_004669 [Cerrena zonata]|uniref:Uncharacterized protein n=1 Tax=Cerrena zonata TaxID=2478898 RepID=A0AAW0GP52_9APHY
MSCPDHIIDDVERARNNITTAFKVAQAVYSTIVNNDYNPDDLRRDVAPLQTTCDKILASFKSTQLHASSVEAYWASSVANEFVTNDVRTLTNDNTPLEERKRFLLEDVLPNKFGQIVAHLDLVIGSFNSPSLPDEVADHVGVAQSIFNKYDLGQLGDAIGLIFDNIPQDVATFKETFNYFRKEATKVNNQLMDLTAEKVDTKEFDAGIIEASSLASDLRDILARYATVVPSASSS